MKYGMNQIRIADPTISAHDRIVRQKKRRDSTLLNFISAPIPIEKQDSTGAKYGRTSRYGSSNTLAA
jgi:hypothetical protein